MDHTSVSLASSKHGINVGESETRTRRKEKEQGRAEESVPNDDQGGEKRRRRIGRSKEWKQGR
jgi:hypothetical protein